MIVNKQLTITGKVQGVYYRASAADEAQRLGLKGEVWNNFDGSVGLIAEGEEDKVNALIAWCRKGPARAEVKNINVTEGEIRGYKNFVVKRF
ncbi:acylphosphatase [Terrimonas sp.]|uniref:acylphosphatase n=1 Tax=Terrimonas sp. TaxID=1914338 RepID=UPI000D513624|nr:acylphosphatase [Terrimonas sp.]PVD52719.1 acylphosphatase [Terrimonas sp.]